MTEPSTTSELQILIDEGKAALLAGDTYEARQRFRRATELEPENAEAWKGLAGSVRPYSEKREYLQRALNLDPTDKEIRATMEYVENKIAAGEYLAPRGVNVSAPTSLSETVVDEPPPETMAADDDGHIHIPDTNEEETGLRCISCGKVITNTKDMVWTPVGQLCADCARARRPPNYQISASTLLIAIPIALIVSVAVSFLVVLFLRGFFAFIIAFFIAPIVAEFIIRLLDYATHTKRGRTMQIAVGVSIALGAAPLLLLTFSLPLLLFTILMITTAVARLR